MDNVLRKNQQGIVKSAKPLWTAQQWKELMNSASKSEVKTARNGL
ncbi:MAG: hypothetical protein ACTH4U_16270 [Pseudoalteromonas prydzensis]|nr:hypothetical protein [Pseudoalteromonas prydzensis]